MKAQSKITLVKLLSAAALVATPLFAGGCIAQTGAGTEDPGSSQQDLTSSNATAAQPQQQALPAGEKRENLAEKFTSTTVIKGESLDEMTAPGGDPGGAVKDDGDGREPDPHPWHTSLQRAAH